MAPRITSTNQGDTSNEASRPTASDRPFASCTARAFWTKPAPLTTARTRAEVSASTSGRSLRTRETVVLETRASRAISLMVHFLNRRSSTRAIYVALPEPVPEPVPVVRIEHDAGRVNDIHLLDIASAPAPEVIKPSLSV